jgi:hypothetical protein
MHAITARTYIIVKKCRSPVQDSLQRKHINDEMHDFARQY